MKAPSEEEGAHKYNNWTLNELIAECRRRKLEFDDTDDKTDLISILLKDDKKPPDWGVIYTRLLNAGLRYDEIPKRTIPQIEAILGEWAYLISIKMPNIFGSLPTEPSSSSLPNDGKPPKVSEFIALANMFSGIQ
jgi:hypothetical protein